MDESKTKESCQAEAYAMVYYDNNSVEPHYSAKMIFYGLSDSRITAPGCNLDALKRGWLQHPVGQL